MGNSIHSTCLLKLYRCRSYSRSSNRYISSKYNGIRRSNSVCMSRSGNKHKSIQGGYVLCEGVMLYDRN